MRARTWVKLIVTTYVLGACTGCAVYLAQEGNRGATLESFRVGTSEREVENQLGTPCSVEPLGAGKRRAVYCAELRKEPSRQRALIHLLLDCVTLGIWELPGTIYELRREHRKVEVAFVYGPDDRILEIQDSQAIQAEAVRASEPQREKGLWDQFWDAVSK